MQGGCVTPELEVSVSKLTTAAAAAAAADADATPRFHKVRRVSVDKEHVTCVQFHHEFEVAEVPARARLK